MNIMSTDVKFGSDIIDQDGPGSNGQIEDAITNIMGRTGTDSLYSC